MGGFGFFSLKRRDSASCLEIIIWSWWGWGFFFPQYSSEWNCPSRVTTYSSLSGLGWQLSWASLKLRLFSSFGFRWDLKLFPETNLYSFYLELILWSVIQWQWRPSQCFFWHSLWCCLSQRQCKWTGTGGSACLKFSTREYFKSWVPEERKSKSSELLAHPMNFFNQHQERLREWLFTRLKGLSLGKGLFLHIEHIVFLILPHLYV